MDTGIIIDDNINAETVGVDSAIRLMQRLGERGARGYREDRPFLPEGEGEASAQAASVSPNPPA